MIVDHLSTASAALLFVVAVGFALYFARERVWWKTPFGRSVMVLTLGIIVLSGQGLAYQILGPHYPGRVWYVIGGRFLVAGALLQRAVVLLRARRADA